MPRKDNLPGFQILEAIPHILLAFPLIHCPETRKQIKLAWISEALFMNRMVQTSGRLFFLNGTFLLFVTCNKVHGSGRVQSSSVLLLQFSSCWGLSAPTSVSVTSSSKGMSGPISRLPFMGFMEEALDGILVSIIWTKEH